MQITIALLLILSTFPLLAPETNTSAAISDTQNDVCPGTSCPFNDGVYSPPPNNITIEQGINDQIEWDTQGMTSQSTKYNLSFYDNGVHLSSLDINSGNSRTFQFNFVNLVGEPDLGMHVLYLHIEYINTSDLVDEAEDWVWIEVTEPEVPQFTIEPGSSIAFQQDVTPYPLVWNATDVSAFESGHFGIKGNHRGSYNLTQDGSEVMSGTGWLNGTSISYGNVDTSTITSYVFSIEITDALGLSSTSTSTVDIVENTAPIFDESPPESVYIQYQTSNNNLRWSVTDQDLATYNVTRNGVLVGTAQEPIPSDGNIDLNIDGLPEGTHSYEIKVYDDYGNVNTDTVEVNVVDNSNPVIIDSPVDFSYTYGEVGNEITYTVYDETPANYLLFRNGSLERQGNWLSYQDININVDGLDVGIHNITVVFFDTNDNMASDIFYVEIHPIGTSTPNIQVTTTMVSGSSESISGSWSCEVSNCRLEVAAGEAQLYRDNSIVASFSQNFPIAANGEFSVILNYTGIAAGTYELQVSFTGTGLQSQILSFDVEVTAVPITMQIINSGNLVRGENYEFFVYTVVDEEKLNGLRLDAVSLPGGAVAGIDITLVVTYTDALGEERNWSATETTDTTGYATFSLPDFVSREIDEITGIEASSSSAFSESEMISLPESEFPQLEGELFTLSDPSNSLLRDTLIYVVIASLALISVGIIAYVMISKSRSDTISYFDQLLGLRSVLLYNSEGVPIFDINFGNFGTSTTLIAGLSTAITTFLDELSENITDDIYIMEKSNLFLLSHTLEGSVLAVISSLPYTETFKSNFVQSHRQIREETDPDLFEKSFSMSDEQFNIKILDILKQNNLHIRILYPSFIKFDLLRESRKNQLPGKVQSNYDILMELEGLVEEPKNIEYWLDALEEFGVIRSEAMELFIELDDFELLTVSTHLLASL